MDMINIYTGKGNLVPLKIYISDRGYDYNKWIDDYKDKLLNIKNLYKGKLEETIKIVNRYYGKEVLNANNCFISGSSLYTLFYFGKFTDIDLFVVFNPKDFDLYIKDVIDYYGYVDYLYTDKNDKYFLIKLSNGVQVIFNKELNKIFKNINNGESVVNVLEKHFDFYHCCFCYYGDSLHALNFCLYSIINKLLLWTETGIDRIKVYKRVNKFVNDYGLNLNLT